METKNSNTSSTKPMPDPAMKIKVTENGPYIVTGNVPLDEAIITPAGGHREYHVSRTYGASDAYALCRCGKTTTPPFCDGTHTHVDFDGTETASQEPFEERARDFGGPGVDLKDDGRCAFARLCHREDGSAWELTAASEDPKLREEAIQASSDCPAGRLVNYDKEGNALEPELAPGITILDDPEKGVSGGLFVKGGVALEAADGTMYEHRNRYALCRCGASHNKPFCDANHVKINYNVVTNP